MPTGASENVTRRVEVFRPGTFRAMSGGEYTFSADDIGALVAAYDAETAPAPAVVGHPRHDDPAFGWVKAFEVDARGILVAELEKLAPAFVDAVEQGRYRKVSMKFFPPEHPANPRPGGWYPRHVGFLGGAAPAVTGLAPVSFADAADLVEIEFGLGEVAESTGSLMRSLREFLIEKFGLESANQAVPEYHIRWIEQAAEERPPLSSAFSDTETEDPMPTPDDLAAREAALQRREEALTRAESVAFADEMVTAGKLIPAQREPLVALLTRLGGQTEEVAFSAADGAAAKAAPGDLLRQILRAQPRVVPLGQTDLGDPPADVPDVAFAAPDGASIDPEGLKLHARAIAWQAQHPGTAYLAAVAAVSAGN